MSVQLFNEQEFSDSGAATATTTGSSGTGSVEVSSGGQGEEPMVRLGNIELGFEELFLLLIAVEVATTVLMYRRGL